jgi:hypothetical protein
MGETGDEGGVGHVSPQMLKTPFLITKVGDSLLVGGLEQREVGGGVAEILAKTSCEHGEEESDNDREL